MKIVEELGADREIQELKRRLYDISGIQLGFNYDCYAGIEDYKQHLRDCVKAGKVVARPQDDTAMHRFDSALKG